MPVGIVDHALADVSSQQVHHVGPDSFAGGPNLATNHDHPAMGRDDHSDNHAVKGHGTAFQTDDEKAAAKYAEMTPEQKVVFNAGVLKFKKEKEAACKADSTSFECTRADEIR